MAHIMNRTLVLPSPQKYYLIKRDKATLEDFYDISSLRQFISVISMEEYFTQHSVSMPDSVHDIHVYLREHSVHPKFVMYDDVLAFPSIESCRNHPKTVESFSYPNFDMFLSNRKALELSSDMLSADTFHFISDPENGYRFFGLWYPFMYFQDPAWHMYYVGVIRSGFHYREELYEAAVRIIDKLGHLHPGKFSALHVRRGDFQYTQTRLDCLEILDHVVPLLNKAESRILYISTDEGNKKFFKPFTQSGFKIYFLDDFMDLIEGFDAGYHGMIEQIVCSGAEIFIGTELSTFSAHITRLRYMMPDDVTPDKGVYFTTRHYTGNIAKDRTDTIASWMDDGSPRWPHAVYFREFYPFLSVDK